MRAADATSPIDYTQRNGALAPSAGVQAEKQKPEINGVVQEKRVPTSTVDKTMSTLGGQRAAVDVTEKSEKQVRPKELAGPGETMEATRKTQDGSGQKTPSQFNHRPAAISTSADTKKPPTVAKYQDSLTRATTKNMAQYPALDAAATAKINRFVFRKNPPETPGALKGSPITPAAGQPAVETSKSSRPVIGRE